MPDSAGKPEPLAELVLGLDTAGAEATLATARFSGSALVRVQDLTLPPRGAGAAITSALRELLGAAPASVLSAIVVVRGPGSFTGMRIGLSAAKALAEACAVPLAAVSRLAVLAETSGASFAALDAGRGSVYLYSRENGEPTERLVSAEEARRELAAHPPEALAICQSKLEAAFPQACRVPAPHAFDAVRHTRARLLAGEWDDPATLDALYLWRAEQMLRTPARQP